MTRAEVFRRQIADWATAGRVGVPFLHVPVHGPEPALGCCVSCGDALSALPSPEIRKRRVLVFDDKGQMDEEVEEPFAFYPSGVLRCGPCVEAARAALGIEDQGGS